MNKRDRLSKMDIAYIQENCLNMTDAQLAKHLGRNIRSITVHRKKLGIQKGNAGKVISMFSPDKEKNNTEIRASQKLTEHERKQFFVTQLANSLFYQNLKDQFTKDELDFYLEEWGSLCVQFEDIVATEKRQIDELIKAEILGNRILRNVKIAEEEIRKLMIEVEDFRKKNPNIANDEQAQERDNILMMMIRSFSGQVEAMARNYQNNVDSKQHILDELNARRKDRVDQIKKGTTTFIGLIEMLREREMREKEGRYMELVRIAKEKKRAQWRNPSTFPDGQEDCILMDDKSYIKEVEYVSVREKSYLLSKYSELAGKKILVLDPFSDRTSFFLKQLHKNMIDIITLSTDIKEANDYDFIMLESKLSDGYDNIKYVESILSKEETKNIDILIHSNDKDFVREALLKLAGNRKVEVCSYNELVS